MSDQHHDPADNPDRWLVSYADFITLLFAFFAVLYATSEVNVEKTKQFEESVKRFLIRFGSSGDSGARMDSGNKYNVAIEPPIKTFPTSEKSHTQMQLKVETFLESQLSKEEIKKRIIEISEEDLGVRLSLSGQKLFVPGTAQLQKDSLKMLAQVAQLAQQTGKKILIESYLPKQAPGSLGGWDLSAQRSSAVIRYFVKVHKIQPNRLVALGYSDSQPDQGEKLDLLFLPEAYPF